MARRSLKPQLNQIRTWVGQGRTDAWIAHQLEVSVSELVDFKREHELAPPAEGGDGGGNGEAGSLEEDLRAQDDALVAAALEAEPDEGEDEGEGEGEGDSEDGEAEEQRRPRRRGRRGGRSRRGGRTRRALEGTFDHGEEGYGLWLDASIQDDPVYAEHWAGHRPVTVTVERDQIVIRRAGNGSEEEDEDEE